MQKSFYAWAIDTGEGGLIGRYWFVSNGIPLHLEGCKTALFTVRRIAREYLPRVKSSYPNARVVRVSVLVELTS